MTIILSIPTPSAHISVKLSAGQALFVVGANGTGKSALVLHLFRQHSAIARRISAHRQTWLHSSAANMTSRQRQQKAGTMRGETEPTARYLDQYGNDHTEVPFYDLRNAERLADKDLATAFRVGDVETAERLRRNPTPLQRLNEMFRLSGFPLALRFTQLDDAVVTRVGGSEYSAAELSDGERNALLIAMEVLTVPPNTLLLLDEPERHLHRGIASSFVHQVRGLRPDCAFLFSTHELSLVADCLDASVLILRGCSFNGKNAATWDADLLSGEEEIDESTKRDLLGSRRKILFVEGMDRSLDLGLYTLLFPGVTVHARGTCREVEHAVRTMRQVAGAHWVEAFGVVDNDRRSADEIQGLRSIGVFALSVYSVESLYYHPVVQERVALRMAAIDGGDPHARLENARQAVVAACRSSLDHLAERSAEKAVRARVVALLPRRRDLERTPINASIDVGACIDDAREAIAHAIECSDIVALVGKHPIRETAALNAVAKALGYQGSKQYEAAVRTLVADDQETRTVLLGFFGDLPVEIGVADSKPCDLKLAPGT